MRSNHTAFGFLFTLCLLSFAVRAQTFEPGAINYTVEHGIPSSECYGLLQDSKGTIWIGTDKGICKFNGSNFTKLTRANGLPDNVVFGFFEDHKNRIWCRTFSKGVFYIEKGKVVIPAFNRTLLALLGQNTTYNLHVSANDSVFISDNLQNFYDTHQASERVKQHRNTEGRIAVRIVDNTGFCIGPFSKAGPLELFGPGGYVKLTGNTILPDMRFRTLVLRNGNIVFANRDCLHLKRAGSSRLEKLRHFGGIIISLYEDAQGGVWVGTMTSGVSYFRKSFQDTPRHYLGAESVSYVIQDTEGNIWLSTLESGIYFMVNKEVENLGTHKEAFIVVKKIGGQHIACSKSSEVWFLNDTGVEHKTAYPSFMHSHSSIVDVFGYKNALLITGANTFLMDKRTRCYTGIFNPQYPGFYKGVRGTQDSLYLFSNGGIFRITGPNNATDTVLKSSIRIMDIAPDAVGNVWVATMNGLYWVKAKHQRMVPVGTGLLRTTRVNAIGLAGSKIVMATEGAGVFIYAPLTGRLYQVHEGSGLNSNSCRSFFIDGRNLWVATNKGVAVLLMDSLFEKTESMHKIDKHDGLPGEEINSIFVDDKQAWIASNSGITRFDKDLVTENTLAPQIWFEYARTNKAVYAKDAPHEFTHDENYMELSFYGTSFKSLRKIRYMYRLSGTDEAWHYTHQPRITYASLAPGVYNLEVCALNNDGVSSKPLYFHFRIRPPFWQTWIFAVVVGCLLFLLIFVLFSIRLGNVRKREREKNFYNNRLLEYEMRALKAQMNPHFVFNAIASIQHFILSHDPRSANKYLVKFSRLIRGVLDNSHSNLIPLERELETLQLYVDIENLRFSNTISFRIVIAEGLDTAQVMIPPLLFQPFVENAIWHGLQPKEGDCMLTLTLELSEGKIVCAIDDNGVGREPAHAHPLKMNKKSSLGIEMTRSRILAMEKIYRINLSIDIIDKRDENQNPAGTTVVITLPVIKHATI